MDNQSDNQSGHACAECYRLAKFLGKGRKSALTAVALAMIPGPAEADEPPSCVLDEECPHGRCIDLVCVDVDSSSTAKPAPAPPPPPSSAAAQPAPAPAPSAEPDPTQTGATGEGPERPQPERARPFAPKAPPPKPEAWHVKGSDVYTRPYEPPAADEPPSSEDLGRVEKKKWYGGPLIGTYTLTAIVVGASVAADNAGPAVLAVFSSPTVHWANGKVGKGFLSLFMQPVFAGIGALAGLSSCAGRTCQGPVITGALVGYAAWATIDIAAIAYKTPRYDKPVVVGITPFRARAAGGVEVVGVW